MGSVPSTSWLVENIRLVRYMPHKESPIPERCSWVLAKPVFIELTVGQKHVSRGKRRLPFDHAMLETNVPSGHYVVTLRYWPKAFSIGLALAGTAVLILACALIIGALRIRGSRHRSGTELSGQTTETLKICLDSRLYHKFRHRSRLPHPAMGCSPYPPH